MSNRSITLTDSLYQYMNDVSLREAPVLLALREETSALTQRSMQIAPEQGQFMALLIGLSGARRCLEIGVFTGPKGLETTRYTIREVYSPETWSAVDVLVQVADAEP